VVVDKEPRSLLEDLQDMLSLSNGFSRAFEKNKGIVSVLEHGAGSTREKGVLDGTGQVRVMEEPTKDVGNNNEKVGGEGVSLPKTIPTVDPSPRDAIEHNNRFAGAK
jgi:hypothetical protein